MKNIYYYFQGDKYTIMMTSNGEIIKIHRVVRLIVHFDTRKIAPD